MSPWNEIKKLSFRELNALLELTQQGKERTKTHARQVKYPKPVILFIAFPIPDMCLVSAANSVEHLPPLESLRQNVLMVAGMSPREIFFALCHPPPASALLLALAPMRVEGAMA